MPIETTLTALPVTYLAMLGALAAFCCTLGWQARRFATRGREAALKRSLLEAKGALPQLESAVRNREERAATLVLELKALKVRLSEHETAARQQELEVAKRDREIRSLNSELTIVKDGVVAEQVLLDDDLTPPEPASADPEMAKRYAALEARYEAMKRGMIKRDDRIAELEDALKNPGNDVPTRTLEHELSELEQTAGTLKATLEERENQLEALQTRLHDEVAQREALEDLAKRRSEGNRELKATAAKLEQQIPELMKTIKSRSDQVTERDAKILSLTRALNDERRAREARETELKDLQEKLAAAAARLRDLQQRMREQEQAGERTAAALRHTIEDRDVKIGELEAAANQQSAKLEMLRGTFFEAKQAHDAHVRELDARHDAQRQALDGLTAEHERLREEATVYQTRVAELEAQVAELEAHVAQRDESLTTQRTESRAQAVALEALRGELTTTRQMAEALTREVADLTDTLARSHSALGRSQGAIMLLVARLGSPRLLLPALAAEVVAANGREAGEPADPAPHFSSLTAYGAYR